MFFFLFCLQNCGSCCLPCLLRGRDGDKREGTSHLRIGEEMEGGEGGEKGKERATVSLLPAFHTLAFGSLSAEREGERGNLEEEVGEGERGGRVGRKKQWRVGKMLTAQGGRS